jgi:hypothetical protein
VTGLEVPKLAEARFCVHTHLLIFLKTHFAGFSTTHFLTNAAATAAPLSIATITSHMKITSVSSYHFTSYIVYVPKTNTSSVQFTLPSCQYF